MFTGLIAGVGTLASMERRGAGGRLTIAHGGLDGPLAHGESIAVSGVCLTVADCEPRKFSCDVLGETLAKSNLGGRKPGSLLNLERALRAGDRMGGHYVQGHVDGVGKVLSTRDTGAGVVLEIGCGESGLLADIVLKGSVACDGVSLTVTALTEKSFSVHLIPTTLQDTSLGKLAAGDAVNVETDIIGKYVRRHLETAGARGGITMEDLAKSGFVG